MRGRDIGNPKATISTAVLFVPSAVRLNLFEIGKDIFITPPIVPGRSPVIEVSRVAPHVKKAIDRCAAAQNLAAGPNFSFATARGVWLGLVAPVVFRIAQSVNFTCRDVENGRPIPPTGFEQAYAYRWIFGQSVSKDTPSSTGADDNIVESLIFVHARAVFAETFGGLGARRPSQSSCHILRDLV